MTLICQCIAAPEPVEHLFKNNIDTIIKDAANGFRIGRGAFNTQIAFDYYHFTNQSILNSNADAQMMYHEDYYLKYVKEDVSEENYFYQRCYSNTSNGIFVYENAERIFDDLAAQMNLKKKNGKVNNEFKKPTN